MGSAPGYPHGVIDPIEVRERNSCIFFHTLICPADVIFLRRNSVNWLSILAFACMLISVLAVLSCPSHGSLGTFCGKKKSFFMVEKMTFFMTSSSMIYLPGTLSLRLTFRSKALRPYPRTFTSMVWLPRELAWFSTGIMKSEKYTSLTIIFAEFEKQLIYLLF